MFGLEILGGGGMEKVPINDESFKTDTNILITRWGVCYERYIARTSIDIKEGKLIDRNYSSLMRKA